jgi:hypothetical protein
MARRSPKDKPDPIGRKGKRDAPPDQATSHEAGQAPGSPARPGLPAPESIVSETEFTSPKGAKYRIIKTTETDPYDKPKRPKGRRKPKKH